MIEEYPMPEEYFSHVIPNQSDSHYRYTVRASIQGQEFILCQTNDAEESFTVFNANHKKYQALCWSINHEVQDEKLSISNRLVRWFRKFWR